MKAKVIRMRPLEKQEAGYWMADDDAKGVVDAFDSLAAAVREVAAAIRAGNKVEPA